MKRRSVTAANKTIVSYNLDIGGLQSTIHRKFLRNIFDLPTEDEVAVEPLMNADEKVIGAGQDTERGDRLSQRPLRRAFSCLVAVGVYSVIISLAFVIVTVTALYATSSSDCKTTVNNAQNIKELVHYDILMVDNSKNGWDTLEKGSVDEEGEPPTIVCNCGEKAVLTVFEVIVLIAVCCMWSHFRAVFLKRKQTSLLKRRRLHNKREIS